MKYLRYILSAAAIILAASAMSAQEKGSGAVMRRGDSTRDASKKSSSGITQRMQSHFESAPTSDADIQWMRVIYRQLDLTKAANAPLYFPEDPVEGEESLFRIIFRLLANDEIPAYEYLDGRESFTDEYRVKVKDMLDRFHVLYTPAKGSSDKHPRFNIEPSDVPANEVLSYYIVERWEFDNRTNRMRTVIEAICPVLHRSGDFGGEAVKYPMFWLKMDDLRPHLTTQTIFTSDDNNLATCTYDDYFRLGLYEGDIYKTRNLRNQSLMQMYPDPDDLARARDSIQNRLETFSQKLWVPDPAEVEAAKRKAKEKKELAKAEVTDSDEAASDEAVDKSEGKEEVKKSTTRSRRGQSKDTKARKPKAQKSKSTGSSNATRSVRNRKR